VTSPAFAEKRLACPPLPRGEGECIDELDHRRRRRTFSPPSLLEKTGNCSTASEAPLRSVDGMVTAYGPQSRSYGSTVKLDPHHRRRGSRPRSAMVFRRQSDLFSFRPRRVPLHLEAELEPCNEAAFRGNPPRTAPPQFSPFAAAHTGHRERQYFAPSGTS
jgi:hypothetical protein